MTLKFTKMHGLGNDFVLIDAISQSVSLTTRDIQQIGDRQFGVGFDQLLVLRPPTHPEADFLYEIYNADGSQAEQCGNGVRCVARFVLDHGLTDKKSLIMQAKAGLMPVTVGNFEEITVNMGQPIFAPQQIPLLRDHEAPRYSLNLFEMEQSFAALSMGNPHAVVTVDSVERAPVAALGARIAKHSDFPQGVNVGFMAIIDRDHIRLRVYERGVGETLACGSGACAAVVAGITQGVLNEEVCVTLPGGQLTIQWQGGQTPVMMTGPAVSVFDGVLSLKQ